MTTYFVVGRNDGVKRTVHRVPRLHPDECGNAYEPVQLELTPGQLVRQIIASDRIKKRSDGSATQ